jgi:hypothetical protein
LMRRPCDSSTMSWRLLFQLQRPVLWAK